MHPYLITALVMAATWDAWRWYVQRVWESPEEAASLALTVAFLGTLGVARRNKEAMRLPLLPVALLLAAFAASYGMLPPIARAAIAIAATLFCAHLAAFKERPPVAFWGLVALALPVVPSLPVLGYPMRLVSAALSVGLLQVHGLAVERRARFSWRDEFDSVRRALQRVNMLWAGLLLTLMGCVLLRFNVIKVMIAVALSLVLAIACNGARHQLVLCRGGPSSRTRRRGGMKGSASPPSRCRQLPHCGCSRACVAGRLCHAPPECTRRDRSPAARGCRGGAGSLRHALQRRSGKRAVSGLANAL
jgi:hypothetical protein